MIRRESPVLLYTGPIQSVNHWFSFQIINQTLTPTWNQMLLFDKLTLCGELTEIVKEPPRIVIEVYDDDALVSWPLHSILWHN